jgi:hypothetical protein
MQLSSITDRFELAFNNLINLVASVVTHLEKIVGKHVINISDDGTSSRFTRGSAFNRVGSTGNFTCSSCVWYADGVLSGTVTVTQADPR